MKPLPLSLQTLYADLKQSVGVNPTAPATISVKTLRGKRYAYADTRDGSARIQRYLGPADAPDVIEQVEAHKLAAAQAKQRRSTVTLLKGARIPAPTLEQGRILEALANAGVFSRGAVLIGSVAYQVYSCALGHYLASAAYRTNDLDISVAELVAGNPVDIFGVLKRAEATFKPIHSTASATYPPSAFHAANGFQVEVLTKHGRGKVSPVKIPSLGCSAIPLSYHEYLVRCAVEEVALYGSGVLVRVPTPARYAVHKLIIAQQRDGKYSQKKTKDLRQAAELMEILWNVEPSALDDALDEARGRGRKWRTAVDASLREIASS